MADIEKIVTGFYSEFILRDILSFVTPGAILLGSLLYFLWPLDSLINELNKLNPLLFIPLFGLCYLIGIGLLMVGEKWDREEKVHFPRCLLGFFPTFYTNTVKEQLEQTKRIYEKLAAKKLADKDNRDDYKKMRERYIIFKQACGNCALSLLFSIIILIIKCCIILIYPQLIHQNIIQILTELAPIPTIIISMVFLIFPLVNGFDVHHNRRKIWEELILDS